MKNYIITKNRTESVRVIAVCRENMVSLNSRRLTPTSDIIEIECGVFKMIKVLFELQLKPKFSLVFELKKL